MSTIYKADTLDELRLRIAEHLEQLSQTRRIEANTVNGKNRAKQLLAMSIDLEFIAKNVRAAKIESDTE